MHEMGLADAILGVVLNAADGRQVRTVQLRIGALQAVVPESLQFWFDILAKETPASSAVIHIEEVPAVFQCRACTLKSSTTDGALLLCEQCGSSDVDILAGGEVLLDSIELETGWALMPNVEVPADVPMAHLIDHAGTEREPFRRVD